MTNLKNLVLFAMFSLIAVPASAAMVETDEILGRSQRAPSAESVERQYVKERLIESGVEPGDAERRVHNMTDTEVSHLYAEFDEVPVGQGVSTTNLLLIIIILILLL